MVEIKNIVELFELITKLPRGYRIRAMNFVGDVTSGGNVCKARDEIKYLFEYNGMDELAELVDIVIEN